MAAIVHAIETGTPLDLAPAKWSILGKQTPGQQVGNCLAKPSGKPSFIPISNRTHAASASEPHM